MAFVGSPANRLIVAGGTASPATVQVPQLVDVSGNGYSGDLFSHYEVVAFSSTGNGVNATYSMAPGVVFAINPASTTVLVTVGTNDVGIIFGKME